MKNRIMFVFVNLIFALILIQSCTQNQGLNKEESKPCFRAAEGDTMWIILNHVKADKQEQFEKLMHEVVWPTLQKSDSLGQEIANHTRVLHPCKMNEDSTFTYIFIMDPLLKGADYSASSVLSKEYDKEKADEYVKMISDCFANPQVIYNVIQSQD